MRKLPIGTAILLAFLVQISLVGWMIADRALLLANGKEIRLAVVPIDPRDLVRGDYVTLTYAISRLDSTALEGDDDFQYGEDIYVSLKQDGDGWVPVALHAAPPADGTWIRGTIDSFNANRDCTGACNTYRVNYNIERFFVPEGMGREIETLRNDQRVAVDVALGADGRAALKRLLVDGVARYDEPFL